MYDLATRELLQQELSELRLRVNEALSRCGQMSFERDPQTIAQIQVTYALSTSNEHLLDDAKAVLGLDASTARQAQARGWDCAPVATLELWPDCQEIEPLQPDLVCNGAPTVGALKVAKQYCRLAQIGHELSQKYSEHSYLVNLSDCPNAFQDVRRLQRKMEEDIGRLTDLYAGACQPYSVTGRFGRALLRAARYLLKRSREEITTARISPVHAVTGGAVCAAGQQASLGALALGWARTRLMTQYDGLPRVLPRLD